MTFDSTQFLNELSEGGSWVATHEQKDTITVCDTFDWRLFHADMAIICEGSGLELVNLGGRSLAKDPKAGKARFVWDLPQGEFHDLLEPILEMRALMPLVKAKRVIRGFNILNEDQKTVLRIELDEVAYKDEVLPPRIHLAPIRGYDASLAKATSLVAAHQPKEDHRLTQLYTLAGLEPGSYQAKPKLDLEPDMRSDRAGKRIFLKLLHVMEENVDGIRSDIDSEFLHDYRVAVRRTRSGLAQIKGIFSEDITNRALDEFKRLGRMTNAVRDLDVYLLARDQYLGMVPEDLQPDLERFFRILAEDRVKEQKKLVSALNARKTKESLAWWHGFIKDPARSCGVNSERPVIDIADESILKRYKRVRKDAKKLRPETPDEAYHDLRIECKKLRYQLEFFTALYPTALISDLVKRLKKLQTVLGEFNDLSVQQEKLRAFTTDYQGKNIRSMTLALGVLTGVLYERQRKLKIHCLEHIDGFVGEQAYGLVNTLFVERS